MTIRLTKTPASVSLPRSLNVAHPKQTAKPDAAPRQGLSVKDGFEASARIRDRNPGGGAPTTVGGHPIPERYREPWNQETYGEKFERNSRD